MMSLLAKLSKERAADIAVILGSGSSINRVTDAEWDRLRKCDTWALNNWVYHPFFVPDFYMIEVKRYDYEIMQDRLREKQESYQNVRFIFPHRKFVRLGNGHMVPLQHVVPWNARTFYYLAKPRDCKRRHPVKTAQYDLEKHCLTKSYSASITVLLELLYRLDYSVIVLYGIDLFNSYYFWSDGDPKYGKVHHLTNKAHENKDPNEPHGTIVVKDFITDFSRMWMWNQGKAMYVGHRDTELYPEVPLLEDWSMYAL